MKYLSLFGINGVTQRQGHCWWKIYACLLISLLATGCATTIANYKGDKIEKPQMSFSEAIRSFRSYNKAVNSQGIIMTGNILDTRSCTVTSGKSSYAFGQVKQLEVVQACENFFIRINDWPYEGLCIDTPDDATRFVDTFIALKYYFSSRFLADDAVAFADFQKKSVAWRALPVKPAIPADIQRFRVAAEDAFKNKKFQEAAEYYEQGLAVEPLWPQGQYNAALLEGELQWYGMAVSHMKRYLELVPDAANAKAAREKMYLWEVKAKE